MAEDALLASELNADMSKVLLNTRKYISSRSEEDLAASREFIRQVDEGLLLAEDEINKPERARRVDEMVSRFGGFTTGIDAIVELYVRRDDIVSNQLDTIGPEVRQKLTEIRTTAAADGDFEAANEAGAMQEKVLLGRLFVAKFLLTNNADDITRAVDELDQAKAAASQLDQQIQNPRRKQLLNEVIAELTAYQEASVAIGDLIAERNTIRDESLDQIGENILTNAAEIKASTIVDEKALAEQTTADLNQSAIMTISASGAAILLGAILAWLIGRAISSSINGMTESMRQLAEGDLDIDLSGASRTDEIGDMTRAVSVFRDNAIARAELEAAADSERQKEALRQNQLDKLVTGFRESISSILDAMGSGTDQMRSSADNLSQMASKASDDAQSALQASSTASQSVQTVAAAVEELSASIQSISTQTSSAHGVSANLEKIANSTNEDVSALSESTDKIGAVVEIIRAIAEQTNLLALNATIEAARAGEAGKGFAVVASEVKGLSMQTAKATEEIGSQINGVQASTRNTVSAINSIVSSVTEINELTATIASAAQQQDSATKEIASSISLASEGSNTASDNVNGVAQVIDQTNQEASEVLSVSTELKEVGERLSSAVEQFLADVARDVDERRNSLRRLSNEPATVIVDGTSHDTTITNTSPDGVAIVANSSISEGKRVELVRSNGKSMFAKVAWTDGEFAGLSFEKKLSQPAEAA